MSREKGPRRPASVYGRGSEPDPRFSLANERTFLAWVRSGLALLAVAAAVHVIDLDVPDVLVRMASAGLAVTALACVVNARVVWARTERAMREGRPLPANPMGGLLAGAVALVALVMVVVALRG